MNYFRDLEFTLGEIFMQRLISPTSNFSILVLVFLLQAFLQQLN